MFGPVVSDPFVLGIVEETGHGPHASDLWRIGRPFYEMDKRGYRVQALSQLKADIKTLKPDVVVLPRQVKTRREDIQRFVGGCHDQGCAVVIDWDDTPLLHRRAYSAADAVDVMIGAWDWIELADAVTCTTPRLADQIRPRNPETYWLPNLISPDMWNDPRQVDRTRALTVGVQGGDSHEQDWQVLGIVWRQLARRFRNLHFVTVGYSPPYLYDAVPRTRFHHLGWAGPWAHPLALRWIDIGCAPLVDNAWNWSKSPIKWFEYSLAGACSVVSKVMYSDWIRPGMALEADTPDDWLDAISYLAENGRARRQLEENSRDEILQYHVHTDETCRAWMDVYKGVYKETFGHGISTNEPARSADRPELRSAGVGTSELLQPGPHVQGDSAKQQRLFLVPPNR